MPAGLRNLEPQGDLLDRPHPVAQTAERWTQRRRASDGALWTGGADV